jgi:RNA polymerase sigma factor (sigma-70 family)
MDDPELVALAKRGDAGAYERLVRRYQDVAWRTAYLITGSEADAEDAAQEAMVKAYSALPRFRADASFRPWLLTIVANEARNRRRAAGRRARLALKVAIDPAAVDPGRSPEAAAELVEQRERLVTAVGALRDRDRDVVALRYLLGLSEAEVAGVLGWPRGTVKSTLSRALGRLRISMAAETAAQQGGVNGGQPRVAAEGKAPEARAERESGQA